MPTKTRTPTKSIVVTTAISATIGVAGYDRGRVMEHRDIVADPHAVIAEIMQKYGNDPEQMHAIGVTMMQALSIEAPPRTTHPAAERPEGATDEKDNIAFSLSPTSPAIDSGDNSKVVGEWDLRGPPYARIVDGNGDGTAIVDRGAYELQAWQIMVPDCPADVDGNGDVGYSDIVQVLSTWGPCPGGPS